MAQWQRLTTFGGIPAHHTEETWLYTSDDDFPQSFPVHVTNGKQLDVMGLKGTDLEETRQYASFLQRTAQDLYAPDRGRRHVHACPCCEAPTESTAVRCFEFIGIPFHRCEKCGHGFVLDQPTESELADVFTESDDHSALYVDRDSLETRMEQIIAPKLQWTNTVYQTEHGRRPRTGIDVGAGGGHFVAGMCRDGIDAIGYELSKASRAFAKEAFAIDLLDEDFHTHPGPRVDILTFWGLLEYTPEPRRFLESARRRVRDEDGLLVVEVPRLDSLGTHVQAETPQTIARHMDPTSHVNTFSDASLATALVETGFRPVAAWYFGMDIYEFLIQAAIRLDEPEVLDRMADFIPALQSSLDHGRQCDDLVIAAVPC